VRVLREALPGPVATGTWAEIEALRARLTALGVGASKGWAGEPLAYLRWSRS
jgi:hypothetical protein